MILIRSQLALIFSDLYPDMIFDIFEEIEFMITSVDYTGFANIKLQKKYWRKFIDEMSSPVFIDRLPGLEDHLLYWYQKNKIIDKTKFITKYKNYVTPSSATK